jgi:hypothetical protein
VRHPNRIINALGPIVEDVFIGMVWAVLSPIHVVNFVLRLRKKDAE